jgi:hypothetical protein
MTSTTTQNDLLDYLYGEQSNEKQEILATKLAQDSTLLQEYQDFVLLKQNLGSLERSPDKSVIDNILQYSQNFVG